ncbi:hypothetical protein JRC04_04990 [Mycolicibacterium sp. S2-37]|uniref:hypothetical protein n=1 Tax=Mycolicibacterium sp. S2-37 TaxID=2810297 RepID=UPI001A94A5FB|nr:hypothetical protein [Mycolicibacterium sp. S2-37]MBO0676813.1 hypothetical protein [Mycolicibacterium sp. S2-37]
MTITKIVEREAPNGDFYRIEVELRQDDSNLSDGFAVTTLVYEKRGNRSGRSRYNAGRDADGGGAAHDAILKVAPELAPVVAVHLADPDGVPMHAVANGWYFYSGEGEDYERRHYGQDYIDRQGTRRERAARALHIPADELPEGMTKEQFTAFAESLRPRWADMAAAARKIIEGL